jgi:hypothetical protein
MTPLPAPHFRFVDGLPRQSGQTVHKTLAMGEEGR